MGARFAVPINALDIGREEGCGPSPVTRWRLGASPELDRRAEPNRLTTGITVVGKRAVIPRGTRIGRNARIDGDVRAADFLGRTVKSGATVERQLVGGRRRGDEMGVGAGRTG